MIVVSRMVMLVGAQMLVIVEVVVIGNSIVHHYTILYGFISMNLNRSPSIDEVILYIITFDRYSKFTSL